MKSNTLILIGAIVVSLALGIYLGIIFSEARPQKLSLAEPAAGDKNDTAYQHYKGISITLVLLGDDEVYFYYNGHVKDGQKIAWNKVRDVLSENMENIKKDSMMVFLKPSANASYKNTVDILDEMTIMDVKRYAMQDLNSEEIRHLKLPSQSGNGEKK